MGVDKCFRFYSKCKGKTLEGFKQRSGVFELTILQEHSGCCMESGTREHGKQRGPLGGGCKWAGERWVCPLCGNGDGEKWAGLRLNLEVELTGLGEGLHAKVRRRQALTRLSHFWPEQLGRCRGFSPVGQNKADRSSPLNI